MKNKRGETEREKEKDNKLHEEACGRAALFRSLMGLGRDASSDPPALHCAVPRRATTLVSGGEDSDASVIVVVTESLRGTCLSAVCAARSG